jgi:hypothetical protein
MLETELRMLQPAREIRREIQPIGVSRLPVGRMNETVYSPDGPWKIVDVRDDPGRTDRRGRADSRGKMPVPVDLITMLREWHAANARPHYLVIAHQLPSTWREGDPLPPIPTPRRLREKDERLTRQLEMGSRLLLGVVGGLFLAPLAPLAIGAAALSGVGGVGADPVIFAGVRHPELPLVEWCYVCSWEWD